MDCWRILGIEPASDAKTIKKAYARLLKANNPEDDAAGYQRIREAYDQAIAKTKKQAANKPDVVTTGGDRNPGFNFPDTSPEDQPDRTLYSSRTSDFDFSENRDMPDPVFSAAEEFMNRVQALYNSFQDRIKPENWQTLLKSDCLLQLDCKMLIGNNMLLFLKNQHYMPFSIIRLLIYYFEWFDREIEIEEKYPEVMTLLQMVRGPELLHYSVFLNSSLPVQNLDDYFRLRELAFTSYLNNRIEEACKYAEKALRFCNYDPQLLTIAGNCFRRLFQFDAALNAFTQMTRIDTKHPEGYYCCASIYYNLGDFTNALEQCRLFLNRKQTDYDGLCLAANCCRMLGDTK
ncbi:MAG TPA: hypothetical protein VHR42_02420, partial [Clostridia bacterium]|nr:hypothetical protein [Clostridia bacterium]